MKSISDYIKQYYKDIYLESMKDIFGEDLPNYIIESAENETYNDFVLETLKTHDKFTLQKKLKQYFSKKYIFYFEDYDKSNASSFDIISHHNFSDDKDVINLIKFFGYYISKIINIDDNEYRIIISPIFTDNANELVYIKNHGKLYHFTTGKHVENILKTGLRCKNKKYRYFPERIYAFSSDKQIKELKDIEQFTKKVVNPFKAKEFGIYIFKIDLNKLSRDSYINFYKDDLMLEDNAVYTYNNIPAECISLIGKLDN